MIELVPRPGRATQEPERVPPTIDSALESCAQRVEIGAKATVNGILQAGQALAEARQIFGGDDKAYGQWRAKRLPWIETDTARRWLNIWVKFGANLLQQNAGVEMSKSVLYLLSAPSTPDTVITQATAKAESGETVTVKDVQEWKQKAAQAEAQLKTVEQSCDRLAKQLETERNKPAVVKEIVKEVVPADYAQLKSEHEALTSSLEQSRARLESLKKKQDELVKDQVRARMSDYKSEVEQLERKRQALESCIKDMETQKNKLDSKLSTEKYYDDLLKKMTNFLVELSVDLSEFDELPERFSKWETMAVQMENGAKAIRHMIGSKEAHA